MPTEAQPLEALLAYPHLEFERPTQNYQEGESFAVVMLPPWAEDFEISLPTKAAAEGKLFRRDRNRVTVTGNLPPGRYFVKARFWRGSGAEWSNWSPPLWFTIHQADTEIRGLLESDHRLTLMLERGVGGVTTMIDPDAAPPGLVEKADAKWFATPVYEGATPLVNEEEAYYRDPLRYYFECIDSLVRRGTHFVTWGDVLEGCVNRERSQVLLQFDIDGGPKSMERIYEGLAARKIRASVMMHRRGHAWYRYDFEEEPHEWIIDAERNGWEIGYHNNSLSQVMGEKSTAPDSDELKEAREVFEADVETLRERFTIRTFTHHGGNVFNYEVEPPEQLELVGVDRYVSPGLWSGVSSMFSDGGFVARPGSLRSKVDGLGDGLHFFRNHPFKYGNYAPPVDVPPRFESDFGKAGVAARRASGDWRDAELTKEARWIEHRQTVRSRVQLSYSRVEKPISRRFTAGGEIEGHILRLRDRRRESFLRLYPWQEGDPRVFWWRLLDAYAPSQGRVLNVGALPPGQKDEHEPFLGHDVILEEVDTDPVRSPDHLADVTELPSDFHGQYDCVLLFGLPYFASPKRAIEKCAALVKPGGIGLFAFVSDTHPARGALWHPHNRHNWREEKEPLTDIGLRGNLWAFDAESLGPLFRAWGEKKSENMGHYWFVVARTPEE